MKPPKANEEATGAPDEITAAVEVLYRRRHDLPPDVLGSLAGIYVCGSATRYRAPHETWWMDPENFTGHDPAACQADDNPDGSGDVQQDGGGL